MTNNKCKLCGSIINTAPIISYKDVPAKAQHLPSKSELKSDKGIDLHVYKCKWCSLIQLTNNPVSYYKDVIRASGFSKEMIDFRHSQFDSFIKKYSLKNIIEIGCSNGDFLSIMKAHCKKASGLEHSVSLVEKCKSKKLNVYQGYIDTENFKLKDKFDSFYSLNYLEHVPNPNVFLKGIYNILEEGGYGLVEIQNTDKLIDENMYSEFMLDHLVYYTKDTLNKILTQNGFDVLNINNIWEDYIISAEVKKKPIVSHQNKTKTFIQTLSKSINNYIDKFDSVSVYGAGHQSFSIISLSNLQNRVKYIVDDADFKQNRYSPQSHIKIISFDDFLKDKTKAIIVIGGSYTKFIIDKLKNIDINISYIDNNKLIEI